jgi:hypothetical protein
MAVEHKHKKHRTWMVVGLIVFGALNGLYISFIGLMMSGGGHGWISAAFSCVSIILIPLLAFTWACQNPEISIRITLFVVVIMLLTDGVTILMTGAEVSSMAEWIELLKKIMSYPYLNEAVILWFIMWIAWQIGAIWRFCYLFFKCRSNHSI